MDAKENEDSTISLHPLSFAGDQSSPRCLSARVLRRGVVEMEPAMVRVSLISCASPLLHLP